MSRPGRRNGRWRTGPSPGTAGWRRAGEQVLLRGGGAALGEAQGAAAAEIDQVREPFGAGLGDLAGPRVRCGGGDAAAELINPGRLDWLLLLVQVSELLIGIGGEGAGGGAVRDAVASCRGEGRHQVIADGLAEPGPQPGGRPGQVLDGGQPLGESPLLTAWGVAAPPGLAPVQQDLPVADQHVAGRGPGMLLDPRGRLAAPRAAARGLRGGVGDHLDQGLPVLGHGHRRDRRSGDPQQDRRRGAARRAGRRGLRRPGGAGNVQRWRFLLRISLSWSKRESRGNRFSSASYCNSQANSWICGRARVILLPGTRGNGKRGRKPGGGYSGKHSGCLRRKRETGRGRRRAQRGSKGHGLRRVGRRGRRLAADGHRR